MYMYIHCTYKCIPVLYCTCTLCCFIVQVVCSYLRVYRQTSNNKEMVSGLHRHTDSTHRHTQAHITHRHTLHTYTHYTDSTQTHTHTHYTNLHTLYCTPIAHRLTLHTDTHTYLIHTHMYIHVHITHIIINHTGQSEQHC